jgi:3-phosphoshikimate 1-carboxyvinyltransferase
MEQVISPARKLVGEVVVPGELEPTEQVLVLAALAAGESRIRNAPPGSARLVEVLQQLGVEVKSRQGVLTVTGCGPQGFRAPEGVVELDGLGKTALLVIAVLAGQDFVTRFKLSAGQERCTALQELLMPMGAALVRQSGELFSVGGSAKLQGVEHPIVDLDSTLKLALLIAALGAEGTTRLGESLKGRDHVVRLLRQRQVAVERRKQGETDHYLVSLAGGQPLQPCQVEMPGDVRLAYPLIAAALGLKGSEVMIRRVAIHPGQRVFLDTMRHMGAPIALEEDEDGTTHLVVKSGGLKSTRIAGLRTEKLLEQIPLLAVLATQAQGEFVIRDIAALRQGEFDYVGHLVVLLRQIGARVGEYPEGIVIKGGFPLQGETIETRGDAGLVLAFAVAGLLAESEMTLADTECMDGIYPGFFATLEKLKEKRK